MTVSDNMAKNPQKPSRETLALRRRYTTAFYKDNKGMMALAAAMTLMLSLFNLAMSYLIKVLLDITSGGTVAQLVQALWWSLATFIFFIVSFAIQREVLPRFLQRAMTQYREAAFQDITKKASAPSRRKAPAPISARLPMTQPPCSQATWPASSA